MRVVKEGLLFAAPLVALAVAGGLWVHPALAVPFLIPAIFVLWFFRDPEREPQGDSAALVSPADGKIIRCDGRQISIFMNVFDVHVCRAPMAGQVESARRTAGSFLAAWNDAASEQNERAELRIVEQGSLLRVTLVAGLIARRIVLWVEPGRRVERGGRIGLIRFGSRVDVVLPDGCIPAVQLGQRVQAGATVLARQGHPGPPETGSGG